ncbi:hypothetical protein ACSFC1_10460 [Pseudothermotoga sp. U03pept]|uniref:hypothetical protein n=1 Tax=Pseudothermotoga sp. U03pept TaxID=3447012 RepID=UPI0030AF6ECD
MSKVKLLSIFVMLLAILTIAQILEFDVSLMPEKRPNLIVAPNALFFVSGDLRIHEVLVYNTNLKTSVSWQIGPSSRFIKIDTSNVPNPLGNLSGGMLKVNVNWQLVEAYAQRIDNPELIGIIGKLLHVQLPERPKFFGMGLFTVQEKIGNIYYPHVVTVYLLIK